jgi:hypothetical protein
MPQNISLYYQIATLADVLLLVGPPECPDKAGEAGVGLAQDFELSTPVCVDHGTQVQHLAFIVESVVTICTRNVASSNYMGPHKLLTGPHK